MHTYVYSPTIPKVKYAQAYHRSCHAMSRFRYATSSTPILCDTVVPSPFSALDGTSTLVANRAIHSAGICVQSPPAELQQASIRTGIKNPRLRVVGGGGSFQFRVKLPDAPSLPAEFGTQPVLLPACTHRTSGGLGTAHAACCLLAAAAARWRHA